MGRLTADLGPDFISLVKVLGLLAWGRPLGVDEVAGELHLLLQDTKDFLTRMGAELDKEGNLIGLGLTCVPTRHAFKVDGHDLYTWCAGDTLLFPLLLGKTANVTSTDPISGAKIRLTIAPEGVKTMEPSTAVLSWPAHMDAKDLRGTVCYPSNWFALGETAEQYASKHPGVAILAPDEFREVSRFFERRIRDSSDACGTESRTAGSSCH